MNCHIDHLPIPLYGWQVMPGTRRGLYRKIAWILVLVTAVPLLIGVNLSWWLGFERFREERKALFETTALHLAETLRNGILAERILVSNWVASGVARSVEELVSERNEAPFPGHHAFEAEMIEFDQKTWPSLTFRDEPLAGILSNEVADRIHEFQSGRPHIKEVLITDHRGRIISASGKSTDYWQGDETWWQKGFSLGLDQVWVEGIHFDDSAGVYSLDISMPIIGERDKRLGVAKVVVDASPLMQSLSVVDGEEGEIWEVALGNGSILSRIRGEAIAPFTVQLAEWAGPPETAGAAITKESLIAYAPLLEAEGELSKDLTGLSPMYVVVRQRKALAFSAFRQQLLAFNVAGFSLATAAAIIGLILVRRKLVAPLTVLRSATKDITAAASESDSLMDTLDGRLGTSAFQPEELRDRLSGYLAQNQTGDEIEDLTRDFVAMSERVISHQVALRDANSSLGKVNQGLQKEMKTIFGAVDQGIFLVNP
ncbi:MAG: cache domain-containing protein, partial [Verrucomicrobiota bacterium]